MGKLLQRMFDEASRLPEQDQEAFAAWALAELESERRWDELFEQSQAALSKLADDARRE